MARNAPLSFPNDGSLVFADEKGGYYAAEDGDRSVYFRPDLAEGAAEWSYTADGVLAGLHFVCPCGCKAPRQAHPEPINPARLRMSVAWPSASRHP